MRIAAGLVAAALLGACSASPDVAVVATAPGTAPDTTTPPTAPEPTAAPTSVAEPPPLRCDGTPEVLGRVAEPLREVSGIVASRAHPGSFWVHNDSGDSARLFRIDPRGQVEAEVAVPGARAVDWEDLAAGPDGRLWVADTGDNLRFRPSVSLWVFPETDPGDLTRIEVTYPDGPHDVEALVVDPADGTAYLFTKGQQSQVFAVGGDGRVTPVTTVPVATVTGADVSADGRTLALLALRTTHLWRRGPGEPWAAMLARPADCVLDAGRGEAVAFDLDGTALFTLPEGVGSPLARTPITG